MQVLYWNLRRVGAPLVRRGLPGKTLTVSEVLGHAVGLARLRADVARVWPMVVFNNLEKVDWAMVFRCAAADHQEKALKFLLDVCRAMFGQSGLPDYGRPETSESATPEPFFLVPHGRRYRQLEALRTPPLARQWGFFLNTTLESWAACFRKFSRA